MTSPDLSALLVGSLADRIVEQIIKQLPERLQATSEGQWPEIMALKTAARYMDRTEPAIRHLIAQREIPAVRADRKLMIRKSAIDAWASRNEI